MGNTQTGEKQHKTGKSPGKGKHFIRNLNKRGSGKESKKHAGKKSNVKLETADRECDKTSESDNNEAIEATDIALECVFKTSQRQGGTRGAEEAASVQSQVTVTRCEAPRRSPTRDQLPAASADPSTSDSLFTDPLTPLAVELNQCYYSAESDSAPDELPAPTPDAPAPTPPRSDREPVAMPHDDIISSLAYENIEKEVKIDVFDDKPSDKVKNEKNMGTIFTHSRAEPLTATANECEHDFLENTLKSSPGQTSFTLSRHRKVELPPVVTEESLHILDDEKEPRFANVSEPAITESNVLRKVASLTLERHSETKLTLERHSETKVTRPKFVPERLDFQLYEKFEGQMLVNWFVSSISEGNYFKKLLNTQDLKILGIQYCTHLLAAGVLQQITDKDAPLENTFKPNLMYQWAHMEEPVSQPVTPGKLDMSSWPPDRIYQPHTKHEPISNISNIDASDYINKNSYEDISDIYTAKTTILELKCKLQELQNQLDYYKSNIKTGTINESLNNTQTIKQENKLDKVKIDLVNKEVQTSPSSDVVNRLSSNTEVCTLKNGAISKGSDVVLMKVDNDKLPNRHLEMKSERRSDKIENYCKLNKSRELNMSLKKDISDIYNSDVGESRYEAQNAIDQILTCESSSEGSFLSTTDDVINDNVCSNIVHKRKLIDSSNVSDVLSSTTNEHLNIKTSPILEIPELSLSNEISSVEGKNTLSESSLVFNTCKSNKNESNSLNDSSIIFVKKTSCIRQDTESTLSVETVGCELQGTSKKQSHQTSNSLSTSEQMSLPKTLKETTSELPTKGETVSKPQKIPTPSPPDPPIERSSMAAESVSSPTPVTERLSPGSMSGTIPPVSMPNMSSLPTVFPGTGAPPPPPMPDLGPPPPPMPDLGPPPPPMPNLGPPPPPMPDLGPAPLPPPMPGMGPPPPPIPGMGPPPPPMPGMGPPPMPGMGPPPPPMPGMGPPPPPMPGMGPPPPPMPGMGPPPPPMPGMGPPPPTMSGVGPPPPPLPGSLPPPPLPPGSAQAAAIPPPPAPNVGPAPFPTPPVGGWGMQRATLRKTPVKPAAPMKPLYWTRILAAPTPQVCVETDAVHKPLWLEIEEANLDNIDEFTDLFSRQVVKAPVKKKVEKTTKIQPIKILDSKRSQNVGILAQSLHVEFSEIENAIYNFDTSVVSLEALQQIYELRASEEELCMIKEHLSSKPEVPLDRPESFLHELSGIQNFAERISCFTFQAEFEDAANTIMHKLDNLKHTCEFLMTSEPLKQLFAIILTLGNYMNGGNCQRGQADGFGLEILAKLKDVKSKQSSTTLLHFIVRTYTRARGGALSGACVLPVPEPGDVVRAAALDFADVGTGLTTLRRQLDECKEKMKKVIDCEESTKCDENTSGENTRSLEVFKEKMTTFLNSAEEKLKTENDNLNECRNKFIATVKFYQYSPKCGKVDDCEPKEFFALWTSFCSDFKDIYKKEEQIAIKEKLKETKKLQCERKAHTQPKKEGGLKARLQKLASTRK